MISEMKTKKECGVCQTRIWEVRGEKLRKTSEYGEIDVLLSNDSKMTVGVCSKHHEPKDLELAIITEKTHQGWLEEVAFGIGNKKWVKEVGVNLTAVGIA